VARHNKITNLKTAFEQRYIPEPNSGCWLWIGTISHHGYGVMRFDNKLNRAHRLSWIIANGEILPTELICHKCNVKLCVNPNHLYAGTAKDNYRDMIKAGVTHDIGSMNRGKTICKRGHALTEENLYILNRGKNRGCKTCIKEYGRQRYVSHKKEYLERARLQRLKQRQSCDPNHPINLS
jgi:hypothetical protein